MSRTYRKHTTQPKTPLVQRKQHKLRVLLNRQPLDLPLPMQAPEIEAPRWSPLG